MKAIIYYVIATLLFSFTIADSIYAKNEFKCGLDKNIFDKNYWHEKYPKKFFKDLQVHEFLRILDEFKSSVRSENWGALKKVVFEFKEHSFVRSGWFNSPKLNCTMIEYMKHYYQDLLGDDLKCAEQIITYEMYSKLKMQKLKQYFAECEKDLSCDAGPSGKEIKWCTDDPVFLLKEEAIALMDAYRSKYYDIHVYQQLLDKKNEMHQCLEKFKALIEHEGMIDLDFSLENAQNCLNSEIANANEIIEKYALNKLSSEKIKRIINDIKTDASAKAQGIISAYETKKRKSKYNNIIIFVAILFGTTFFLYKYIYSLKIRCENCNSFKVKTVKSVELDKYYKYRRKDNARDQRYKKNPIISLKEIYYLCSDCGLEFAKKIEEEH